MEASSCSLPSSATPGKLDALQESCIDSLPDDALFRILSLVTSKGSSFPDLAFVSKSWLKLIPRFHVNLTRVDTSGGFGVGYRVSPSFCDDEDNKSTQSTPTWLSAPALFRTLSLAPNVTSVSLGSDALDFYDDSLESLLAACPKLSHLNLAEPRFTGEPYFRIGLKSLDKFLRAAGPQLQELTLSHGLGQTTELLGPFESLTSLRVLGLHSQALRALPDEICLLYALKELSLGCPALRQLPEAFGQLASLSHVSFWECKELQHLPDSFIDLSSLSSLKIHGHWSVDRFPDRIGAQLRRLHLQDFYGQLKGDSDNGDRRSPSGSCKEWVRLEDVTLSSCHMRSFEPSSLLSLTRLTITGGCSFDTLPAALPSASALRQLTVKCNRSDLRSVSWIALSSLTSLERLEVLGVDNDELFPEALFALPLLAYAELGGVNWMEMKTRGEQMAERQEETAKRQEEIAEGLEELVENQEQEGCRLRTNSSEAAVAVAAACDAALSARAAATAARAAATDARAAATAASAIPYPPLGPSLKHLDLLLYDPKKNRQYGRAYIEARSRNNNRREPKGNFLSFQLGSLLSLTRLSISDLNTPVRLPPAIGQLHNLRALSLSGTFTPSFLPDSLSLLAPSLHFLSLVSKERSSACPPFLTDLTSLTHLHLFDLGIPSPSSFLTRLSSLRTLRIRDHSLTNFPVNLGQLAVLEWLDLDLARSDDSLPGSLWDLTSLKKLHLKSCKLGQRGEIHELSRLEELLLENCVVDKSPCGFSFLGALKKLTVHNTSGVFLPDSFGGLSSLEEAIFQCCKKMSHLPSSFCLLPCLRTLTITGCENLVTLPANFGSLTSLKKLAIDSCTTFQRLPDSFSSLASLVHLTIIMCPNFSSLPGNFGSLPRLARLQVVNCDHLTRLPASFPSLPSLRVACFNRCKHLHSLPQHMGLLLRLEVLQLRHYVALKSLPASLKHAKSLRHVDVYANCLEEGIDFSGHATRVHVLKANLYDHNFPAL